MMQKARYILVLLFVACTFSQSAVGQGFRKYSNEFLAIGVGARSLGMSGAQTALTNDVTAAYWNPAGLSQIESDVQIGAMHAEYFAGIAKYDYATVAKPLKSKGTIGFTYIRFGIDNIPNTIELIDQNGVVNYDRITTFSAADNAFIISYATPLSVEGLSVGGNAKIIYRKIGDFANAWGFGIDLGAQYKKGDWLFGATARDVTTTFNAWNYSLDDRTIEVFQQTGNAIPQNNLELTAPSLTLGIARRFQVYKKFYTTAAIDFINTFDGQRPVLVSSDPWSMDPRFGLEVEWNDMVFIRGGVGNIQKQPAVVGNFKETTFQPNIGLGVHFKSLTIDYALTDIGDQSVALYSNVFSLKLDIHKRE